MNPLMSLIGSVGGSKNPMSAMMQAVNMINQIKKSGNPQAAFNQVVQSNTQIKQAMDMCKDRNPQQVFEQMCKRNGMDPAQFTGMLK